MEIVIRAVITNTMMPAMATEVATMSATRSAMNSLAMALRLTLTCSNPTIQASVVRSIKVNKDRRDSFRGGMVVVQVSHFIIKEIPDLNKTQEAVKRGGGTVFVHRHPGVHRKSLLGRVLPIVRPETVTRLSQREQINFTKRDKELAREQQSPNKQTPEQALALAVASMETPKSDAGSGDTALERMEAMYDEATKVLPPSSELYKKALQAVVRTTFQHACVATREVLRNNPQLITVGQEQLLPGRSVGSNPG